ncbi:MAG TPA: L-threonylcarbamoyladenylate synthase [Vicinamibacterales bacterium]|nr:L-threonylcarbamoyladenylate synthase [Vicinamibacterales bacterium]HPW20779.1 L-threonylcarbamoyladenylate synthase [Vicinamibacterales bacterium]
MVSFQLDAERPDPDAVARAAAILRGGGVIAYPTDTLYGLGADPANRIAVAQLYRIKGRPVDRPIPLIGASVAQVAAHTGGLAPLAAKLAGRFWPGPLTLILPAWPGLDEAVLAGTGTAAIRVPAHPVARALAAACGWPITSTSANRTGEPPPSLPSDVRRRLEGALDAVIDGGPAPGGPPSTIVDATGPSPRLVRPGAVPWERVLECLR